LDVPLAGHARGLDEQDRAAERRPGEACGDAGDRRALRDLTVELRLSEVLDEVAVVDRHRALVLAARDLEGCSPAELLDLAVELPNAGLSGVVADDAMERRVRDGELRVGYAVIAGPPRHEM